MTCLLNSYTVKLKGGTLKKHQKFPLPSFTPEEQLERRIVFITQNGLSKKDLFSLNDKLYKLCQENTEPIFIFFETNGGNVKAGYQMYRLILEEYREKYNVVIVGIAWGRVDSIGVLVFQACTIRIMYEPGSSLYFHLISAKSKPITAETDLKALFEEQKKEKETLQLPQEQMYGFFLNVSTKKISKDRLRELFRNDTRIAPQPAIELGFADKVIYECDFNNLTAIL